jgi:predicted transcriptional regulator
MSARCETIGKYVLPIFRSHVAKELVGTYHLTQVDAAKKLKTTQAAISQYLSSKRATKGNEEFAEILPKIQVAAKETAKRLVNNQTTWDIVTLDFCKLCVTFYGTEENTTGDNYNI